VNLSDPRSYTLRSRKQLQERQQMFLFQGTYTKNP